MLAAKEGQKELPDDIERTLSDILYYFKDSSLRRDEFKLLKEMVEPESPLVAVVLYHRVRWLSLSDCVSLVVQLLPLLVRYFEEQVQDTHNRPAFQSKCRDLHARVTYMLVYQCLGSISIFFLESSFRSSGKNYKWLQSTHLTLNTVYCKIQALLKSFTAPVVLDSAKSVSDEANLRPLEEALALFPGADFQKHISDCIDHALLSERGLNLAKKTCIPTSLQLERLLNVDSRNLTS